MKVAFYVNSLFGGGAERVTTNLVLNLDLNGVKKVLLLNEKVVLYPYEGEMDFLLSSLDKGLIGKTIKRILLESYFVPALALAEYIRRKRIDLCISMETRTSKINALSGSRAKKIVSLVNYYDWFKKEAFSLERAYYTWLYSKVNYIVAVSKGIADSLVNCGICEDRVKVIYNPLPLDKILYMAQDKLPIDFEDFILNVGRLTSAKGQWHLLRIFKSVKQDFPNIKLVILGYGSLKEDLFKLSKGLGFRTYLWDSGEVLNDKYDVYFMGFDPNPFKYMLRARIFALTSLWEGLPNVLLEALACGAPIISSDCRSGPREILAPDTDFKYETDEPEFGKFGILMPVLERGFLWENEPLTQRERVWANTIKWVLSDIKITEAYRSKAFERANHFSLNSIREQWESLIFETLGK